MHVCLCGSQKLTSEFFSVTLPLSIEAESLTGPGAALDGVLSQLAAGLPLSAPEPRDCEQARQACVWDWRIGPSVLKLLW